MRPTAGEVTLHSVIPASHAKKQAIEGAVQRAFHGLPGSWTVAIVPEEKASWWVITIEGPRGFQHMLLVGPDERDPELLHDSVRETPGR